MTPRRQRSTIDLYACILEKCIHQAKKTAIMYGCYMSHKQVNTHLPFLIEKSMIERSGDMYRTREKGLRFLGLYENLVECLR